MIYSPCIFAQEASHSGLVQRVANPRPRKGSRGFESHRFRSTNLNLRVPIILARKPGLITMNHDIYTKEYLMENILSHAWSLFKDNFRVILLITLIIYIPINLVLALIPLEEMAETQSPMESFQSYMRIMQILEGLIGIIATMAIAHVVKNSIDGKAIPLGVALNKSMTTWVTAVKTNFISGLYLLGLTLLLIVPGVIYYVYWSFALLVATFHGKSGKSAMDYSKAMVKGRWWRVAIYSFVFGLLSIITGLIAGAPLWFFPEGINVVADVTMSTLIDIIYAYFTVVTVVFFINFDSTKKEAEAIPIPVPSPAPVVSAKS